MGKTYQSERDELLIEEFIKEAEKFGFIEKVREYHELGCGTREYFSSTRAHKDCKNVYLNYFVVFTRIPEKCYQIYIPNADEDPLDLEFTQSEISIEDAIKRFNIALTKYEKKMQETIASFRKINFGV